MRVIQNKTVYLLLHLSV